MALPILLVYGFAEYEFYSERIKASEIYRKRATDLVMVDFRSGTTSQCKAIAEKIASNHYPAVIISDLNNESHFRQFIRHIGPALITYVEQGGRVAFPTSEGILLLKVLKELFGVSWERATYCRTNFRAPDGRKSAVDEAFPLNRLHDGKKLASDVEFSVKAVSYKNVPVHEQFFGNTGEGHSKFPGLDFLHKEAAAEQEGMWMYSVVVHKFGQGSIAFFGDVNGEPVTCDLIAAYCLA